MMFCAKSEPCPARARENKEEFAPAVEAGGLGVRYMVGSRREDVQSRILNRVLRRRCREYIWALRSVDLSFYQGEIIGVIGSNGAGKTTLCSVIAGQLRPDEGWIRANGRVTALLSIGAGFSKELSGFENIFLNAMILGFSKKEVRDRLDEIISFSGLGSFIDEPLKYYSNGMRSRLAFSIAATVSPEILVMDEALSAGDAEFSEKAGEKLQSLMSSSTLSVMVSHNLHFVKNYCRRAIWMDKGQIREMGDPEDVVASYREAYGSLSGGKKRPPRLKKTKALIKENAVITAKKLGIRYTLSSRAKSSRMLWALKDVDLDVREGEILGIIGANGAGKTTLCRALSGILKPDAGSVRVYGRTSALMGFGTGFNIQLSGRDNVYLNGLLLGMKEKAIDRVYGEIVDFSGLHGFMEQPVKNYSGGMRARLGFSIVSQLRPDIFVVDEALNAGDIEFYEKASEKIQELMAEAKATIVVTHNLQFIEKICNRAIWLDGGSIVFDGDTAEALSRYRQSIQAKREAIKSERK
ncbi:MAG: ABC transporter ATP-binding protein [Desulfosalsimonadaceae bacterium]